MVGLLCLITAPAVAAMLYVDDDDPGCGGQSPCYTDIQSAINAAVNGDTIIVRDGIYTGAVNIDGRSDLTVQGVDNTTVILRPGSTVDWGGPYGSAWQVGFRVNNSGNITVSNMTLDFDTIKSDQVCGLVYFESTGTVTNNVLMNMSIPDTGTDGELEITMCVESRTYTPANPAQVIIESNVFIDTGWFGVSVFKYVDVDINGNTFTKTAGDYGFGIEIGAEVVANIRNNDISGFITPSAISSNPSLGVSVNNHYSAGVIGGIETVFLEANMIHDCQWGLLIGNYTDGIAGDVDIYVEAFENEIYDNLEMGIYINDEDASQGSSVVFYSHHNLIENNTAGGTGSGIVVYSYGDGDLSLYSEYDFINGHDIGVDVDESSAGSQYIVFVRACDVSGNDISINNHLSGLLVNGSGNWWGTRNPGAVADLSVGNVDYTPWLSKGTDESGDPGFQPRLNNLHVDDDSPQYGTDPRIKEGIQWCDNGTVNIEDGNYTEDIAVYKSVTLSGAGPDSTILHPAGTQVDFYYGNPTHILIFAEGAAIENLQLLGNDAISNTAIMVEDTNGSEAVPISNVTIEFCEIHDYGFEAIVFASEHETIENVSVFTNVIHNNPGNQITLLGNCDTFEIFCNDIFNSQETAIRLFRSGGTPSNSNILIQWNNIFDNDNAGLIVDSSAHETILNASYNWWDRADGPGGDGPGTGDHVYGWVNYAPWLGSEQLQPCPAPPIPAMDTLGFLILILGFSLAIILQFRR